LVKFSFYEILRVGLKAVGVYYSVAPGLLLLS